MTIEHKDIQEAGLHEPKGVSTATVGQVYVADGFGGGAWKNSLTNAGNIRIDRVLDGASLALTQLPVALDTPLAVEFGPAVNDATDPANLTTGGTLIINEAGTYRIKVSLTYGRTGSTGISEMYFRAVVNGVQAGQSIHTKVTSDDVLVPYTDEAWIFLEVGTTISYELIRDSAGVNSGGLYLGNPVLAGWNNNPSAAIRVERWV